MREIGIGKEVVDAAVKVNSALGPGLLESVFELALAKDLKLGYLLNFGAALMKEGIKRIVTGLAEESLGVSVPLREPYGNGQPSGDLNSESLRSTP